MRVVFCWPLFSGYMAACWKAMRDAGEVDFKVLAFGSGQTNEAPFAAEVMSGVPHLLLDAQQREDAAFVAEQVVSFKPDVVVLPGWSMKVYRALVDHPSLRSCKFVMAMDNPWLGKPRQHIGRFVDRKFRKRISAVVVPGERGFQFAHRLGFDESRIYRGVYGVESSAFQGLIERREQAPNGWPKRFLFVGRFAPEKGVDTLAAGYRMYRDMVDDPWALTCCGGGDLAHLLDGIEGVDNRGFVQPADMPGVYGEAGCFVLCSRYDPWPLVIVEACMTGLPVVCSAACGSGVELVRPLFNGLIYGTGTTDSLVRSLMWMHGHHDQLPAMGRHSAQMGSAYTPGMWAARWTKMFTEI